MSTQVNLAMEEPVRAEEDSTESFRQSKKPLPLQKRLRLRYQGPPPPPFVAPHPQLDVPLPRRPVGRPKMARPEMAASPGKLTLPRTTATQKRATLAASGTSRRVSRASAKGAAEAVTPPPTPILPDGLDAFRSWIVQSMEKRIKEQDRRIRQLELALHPSQPQPPLHFTSHPIGLAAQPFRRSTYDVGTSFERTTIDALQSLGMSLVACGGSGDRGVDFRGTWSTLSDPTPETPTPTYRGARVHGVIKGTIRIIGQCKRLTHMRVGPAALRDFAATLSRESPGTLGIFSSWSGFSTPARQACILSKLPILLVTINEEGNIQECIQSPSSIPLLSEVTVAIDYRFHVGGKPIA